ncbi:MULTISPECIES: hypothetical protein [Sorangium]|uniref:Uncharacterized protein n=1 Tax=Sorangium cellulosum (strain So ce56) TaxID=448385 RepID=A9G7L7_SORC5|nr:hypothetical protein [Sorangium cellulosum]CAN95877.1 hypothetical protein sce5714 [Sorangium cellulosum So ce56]
MSAAYTIADEPRPGRLAEYTVNPFWPLLTTMLAGSWAGLPWFIFNGKAMGSAGFRREALIAALTPVAAVVLAQLSALIISALHLPDRSLAYAFVIITAAKLGAAYWLYTSQHRSFGIYEHFGGRVRQGAAVAIAAAIARDHVVRAAFDASNWLGIVVM